MKWTPGTENDDVVDVRGASGGGGGGGGGFGGGGFGGGGMKIGAGGAIAVIGVILVARLFGVDLTGLLGSGGGGGGAPSSGPVDHKAAPIPKGQDPEAALVDFVKFVMKDIQDTFDGMYKERGWSYRRAKLVLFREEINTGCGKSSAAIGPFYCPPDEHAYIDLSFYQLLKDRLGAGGDFAQAYVLAHEIGHHLQKMMGNEEKEAKLARSIGKNAASVRLELQADCFAGVWGYSANQRKLLEVGDLEEAINAAGQIGDDRLQSGAGRKVNPETFTHGSAAQRVKWFRRGYDSGKFEQCDTFSEEP